MKCPKCGHTISYQQVRHALSLATDASYASAITTCAGCHTELEVYYPFKELREVE